MKVKSYIRKWMKFSVIILFALFLITCKKDNSTSPVNNSFKYCGRTEWRNTLGQSGFFTGTFHDEKYFVVEASLSEDDEDHFFGFHRNEAGHLQNDQPNFIYTYNNDYISKIEAGEESGKVTYNFNELGQITTVQTESSDETGITFLSFTYTYDKNGDPVNITGMGQSVSEDGKTSNANYTITADYLTNKPALLGQSPELAPFTIYFSYFWCLSKHLINKWQVKIDGTDEEGKALPTNNFVLQYTYTYDNNGMVSSMFHTGNSTNTFTFQYSECH